MGTPAPSSCNCASWELSMCSMGVAPVLPPSVKRAAARGRPQQRPQAVVAVRADGHSA